MHTWLVVWFVIGIASALALVVCLVGLGRHVLITDTSSFRSFGPLLEDCADASDVHLVIDALCIFDAPPRIGI